MIPTNMPIAIISVRNNSTRLPKKALTPIYNDYTAIDILITRALHFGFFPIVATSYETSDDPIANCSKKHIDSLCFRGALPNKLHRWFECFDTLRISKAVIVDGDDIMYDFEIAKRALDLLNAETPFVQHPKNIICGLFTYAFTLKGIETLYNNEPNPDTDTDIITPFIEKTKLTSPEFKLNSWEKNRPFRLTLDYEEDLDFFKKLTGELGIKATGKEITAYLDAHTDVAQINIVRQKDYIANQKMFIKKKQEASNG